ncbi:hypothetical protein [Flavobacterium psychrolimnae]|nr:hypothetical protein [Flavobacterium psychrolimnae]
MMRILQTALFFLTFSCYSQFVEDNEIKMISAYDHAAFGSKEFVMETFQGIEKLNISFSNATQLRDKNFKIIIRKYKNGKIEKDKVVIDTRVEGLPKIGKEFKFSIITQHILNKEKIAFFFSNFFNKQIFEINKSFDDGTFLLREVTGGDGKIDFQIGKETQIGLITPPNNDPGKGDLGYCEVSKGTIDVKEWYKTYKISEFFLVYLLVENK